MSPPVTDDDMLQLHRKPLVTNEFIGPLCKIDPIYKEEEEAFKVCVTFAYCITQCLFHDGHWKCTRDCTPCRIGMRRPQWERSELRLPKEVMKMMERRAKIRRKGRRRSNKLIQHATAYYIRVSVDTLTFQLKQLRRNVSGKNGAAPAILQQPLLEQQQHMQCGQRPQGDEDRCFRIKRYL